MNSKMFNINTILRDGVERDVDRKGESIMEMSEKLMERHSKGYNCGQIICAEEIFCINKFMRFRLKENPAAS